MIQTVVNKVVEFLVNYSFQVIGALIVLFVGWQLAQWAGKALKAAAISIPFPQREVPILKD